MKIINPATEEIICEMREDTPQTIESKFKLLKAAQKDWQNLLLPARVAILKRFAALLKERAEQLADTLTSEVGKPLQQSRNEINGAWARINWLTEHAEKYLGDEIMSNEERNGRKNCVRAAWRGL